MHKRNLLLFLYLILYPLLSSYTYNMIPQGIPAGLPAEIKGKFRIIEHSSDKSLWNAYDVNRWEIVTDRDPLSGIQRKHIRMYPPIHAYILNPYSQNQNNKWEYHTETKQSISSIYVEELATIINPKDNKQTKDEPLISAAEAKTIITSKMKTRVRWTLRDMPYNNGLLICGNNTATPKAIAVWWAKGSEVYNVNGWARTLTPELKLSVYNDAGNAYDLCLKNK